MQIHLIGQSKADTRHFMEQETFKPPLESSVSTQSKLALTHWKEEAKDTLPHPIWTAEAVYGIK